MKKILKEDAILRLKKHNPNITLIGEYVGMKNKTDFKCGRCNTIRYTSFNYLLDSSRKIGCVKCEKRGKYKKSRIKSHEQYLAEIYDIWGNSIKIIGQYDGGANKIKTKCNECNNIWYPNASALLKKHGCPICGHKKNRIATTKKYDLFINEVKSKHDNILVIGNYISGNDRILVKCKLCNHEWSPVARGLTRGRGCPICKLNKGEKIINNILVKLNIKFKPQFIIKNLKTSNNGTPIFDFAIFNNDNKLITIIEYDGIQHFKSIKNWGGEERYIKQQKVDEFKNKYCDENNIRLIRIKYTELNKINSNYIKNKLYGE